MNAYCICGKIETACIMFFQHREVGLEVGKGSKKRQDKNLFFFLNFLLDFRFWGTWAEHARQLRRYTHGSVFCFLSPLHPHLAQQIFQQKLYKPEESGGQYSTYLNNFQPRILYPAKLSFISEGKENSLGTSNGWEILSPPGLPYKSSWKKQ